MDEQTPPAEPVPSEFYVVSILNARELAISGGRSKGIEEGETFRVLSPSQEIKDPITGESLGELVLSKALVKVYEVGEKYALARTFRSKRVKVSGGMGLGAMDLFNPPKYETRTETLIRDASFDVQGEIAVEPGDPVERWEGATEDAPSTSVWR